MRWILVFFHSGDETGSDRGDFPKVDFWQPDEATAIAEARRVLQELRARGDGRDWRAAGHPDPYAVAKGRHPIEQWTLTAADIESDG